MIETYWGSLAQVGATIVALFVGLIIALMVYLRQKQDEVNSQVREKKLELADQISLLIYERSPGDVSFFAGNFDLHKLHEASSDLMKFINISNFKREEISQTGKVVMDKLREITQLLPSLTWSILSSRFTGIDSRIAELPEEEYEIWHEQMYNYSVQIETIWKFSKERFLEILDEWEESWHGAKFFLSKRGVESFFENFSKIKDVLFEIQRIRQTKKSYNFSRAFPYWQITFIGITIAFIVAVILPLYGLINNFGSYPALVSFYMFCFSMIILVIPFFIKPLKEEQISISRIIAYFRHLRNVLYLKWNSKFGKKPEKPTNRELFIECNNLKCRKEFHSRIRITSSDRVYNSKNIDQIRLQCHYCGKSFVYYWKDFHFNLNEELTV